jgi:hypothetical protein
MNFMNTTSKHGPHTHTHTHTITPNNILNLDEKRISTVGQLPNVVGGDGS